MLSIKRVAKTIFSLLPLGIVASAVLGCSNLGAGMGTGGGTSNASNAASKGVVAHVAMPGQAQEARSAMPDFANTDFVFAGTITASGATPSGADFKAATYNSTDKTVTFALDVSTEARANYVLGVYAFPSGTMLGTSTAASAATLCGTTTVTVPANASSITISNPIPMLPNFTSAGKGSVELAITIPTGYTLACACSTAAFSYSGGKITATNVAVGEHNVTFSLQKSGQTVASYAWKETLHVYPGMKTNQWNDGATKTINDQEIFNTFYVRGDGGTWISELVSASAEGNDETGNGSLATPYATVQKAVDRIIAINDGNTPFTIYVDGIITAASGKNVARIENKSGPKLTLSIIGLGTTKAVFKGNGTSVMLIRSGYQNYLTLSLQNLKITDGGSSTSYGGGINAGQDNNNDNSGGTITLTDCEISGNVAKTGGGISYFSNQTGDTSLTLNNCVVTKNTAQYGGGIFAWRGTVVLDKGTVIGDASSTLTSVVGESNCGQSGTGIGGNLATNKGGGICLGATNKGLIIKEGCYVSANYCSGANGGGGIFIESTAEIVAGKAKIESGAYVQYNYAASGNGGGIYIDGKPITIAGSVIGNRASANGNAIYNNGTLTMSGAAKINSDNDVYLTLGNYITVGDTLTGAEPVAVITVDDSNYKTTTKVLDGTDALISENCGKFDVTPQDDGSGNLTYWSVNTDGYLKKALPTVNVSTEAEWMNLLTGIRNGDYGSPSVEVNINITADLDLRTYSNSTIDGNYMRYFSGVLNGNGHTIKVKIQNSGPAYAGLIYENWGTIKNLNVEADTFTNNASGFADSEMSTGIGGICAVNNALVSNCSFSGTINTHSGSYIGGIVGNNKGKISNCTSTAVINCTNTSGSKGQIAGWNSGTIDP